jgi:two-component system sensor histidine kinase KdpD
MVEEIARPDPDVLLRHVTADEEKRRRGKLKIFFGYAPGVGKTYAMLAAARELTTNGVEVVIGHIDTHGRFDTAGLVLGMDILPSREVAYRGQTLEEFDLEAALARKPRILLLDELAHTNAPGGRHAKRWQDVLDLLEAGIEVHTTLNVQHVESLNDVVAQVTTIRVRETVPDAILDRADEIALVDLPPEELLARLREGKVYLPDQISRAAENFFRRGNLLALRELALRRTADRVDADVLAHREEHSIRATWPTAERILVCVGPGPASARLVRAARRMAAGLRAPWIAACVEPSGTAPMTPGDREEQEAHLRLAESLGGEVVRLSGARVGPTLLDFAGRHNVTRIVIGKPTHSRIRDLLRGSLLDDIVRGSGDIDVHVISGDTGHAPPAERAAIPSAIDWPQYGWTSALVAAATATAVLGRQILSLPDLVMIYLLVIMIVAIRFGRGPSTLAAALSVATFDFFFVPPYYTFAVSDARHLLTFAMMFGVGLLISSLTMRLKRQEQEARTREERTASLYALSRELGAAVDERQVAEVMARQAAAVFGSGAAVLMVGAEGSLDVVARSGDVPLGAQELAVGRWVIEHARPAGSGTDTLPGAGVTCLPIGAGSSALGVLALAPAGGRAPLLDERHFLDAFVRQGALALERARLAESVKTAALRARTEEMRSSLLGAVSHDLRTPLAAITGAATTLRDGWSGVPQPQRQELLMMICEEAERLERLVANLLDMTRLESGSLHFRREWVPLEEIIGSALTRLESRLAGRAITTTLPPDLPLIQADPVLFGQLFVNLLENAAKYTPDGSPIEIGARVEGGSLLIDVVDHGPGLPRGMESRVFEKFFRGTHAGVSGVGLGLSICRGVAQAHGGTITAESRAGATFRITLPLVGRAPSLQEEGPAAAGSGAAP